MSRKHNKHKNTKHHRQMSKNHKIVLDSVRAEYDGYGGGYYDDWDGWTGELSYATKTISKKKKEIRTFKVAPVEPLIEPD